MVYVGVCETGRQCYQLLCHHVLYQSCHLDPRRCPKPSLLEAQGQGVLCVSRDAFPTDRELWNPWPHPQHTEAEIPGTVQPCASEGCGLPSLFNKTPFQETNQINNFLGYKVTSRHGELHSILWFWVAGVVGK